MSIHIPAALDAKQLQDDLAINQLDLSDGMMRQAALFAHYSRLAAQAERTVGKIEQIKDVMEARIDREVRDKAASEGKKYTEAQIKNQVLADPRYIKIATALNEANFNVNVTKSAADSFRHRRDMLIQLAFNAREEAKGELRLNGATAGSRQHDRASLFRQTLVDQSKETAV